MNKNSQKRMKLAIGKTIKRHRENMNLSQVQLAKLVYDTAKAQILVSRAETGTRNIPTHEIIEYIRAFRIQPQEFFKKVQTEFSKFSS